MFQLTIVLWALLACIGFLLILVRPDGYEVLYSHKILFQFYFPFIGICYFLILPLSIPGSIKNIFKFYGNSK
jgi:hypothetical protein